jgi:hypothetical protein
VRTKPLPCLDSKNETNEWREMAGLFVIADRGRLWVRLRRAGSNPTDRAFERSRVHQRARDAHTDPFATRTR